MEGEGKGKECDREERRKERKRFAVIGDGLASSKFKGREEEKKNTAGGG